ncbi:MAG TPA: YdcF family protein [Vicinamibacterales bacterium]|nr:YdcF family protein [Vicinamibacterales bacterium]
MPPPSDDTWVVALLIGELSYMNALNPISTRIVERAVEVWRRHPQGLLICEAEPMAAVARSLGVPEASLRVAIPEPGGHTTRWCAQRIAQMHKSGTHILVLVTHRLHARRAGKMFAALGLRTRLDGLDVPFDRGDPDWKLRSTTIFKIYNAGAWVYCLLRGWL